MKEIAYEQPSLEETVENTKRVVVDNTAPHAPLVRTFTADVSNLLAETKTTKFDIVMAEKNRRNERQKSMPLEEEGSHLGRIIFVLALLVTFGIGVGAYVLIGARIPIPFLSPQEPIPGGVAEAPEQEEGAISITDSPREQILVDIAAALQETTAGEGIRIITFTIANTGDKTWREATTGELLSALSGRTPQKDLVQSLDKKPMFGIFGAKELSGFLKLRSRSYPETFSGMLLWEQTMAEDLIPALRPDIKRSDVALLKDRAFKDERILGVSARVLSDPGGNSLLAYAFSDQQMLIIAGGRDALRALIEKFRREATK